MNPAPLLTDEQERIAALHKYHLLDTGPDETYDEIVRLAAFLCDVPIAVVSLLDLHRQCFKSVLGLSITETPRELSFCTYAILAPEVMVVPDTREDPRFAENPFVTGEMQIRFYAGAPLINKEGYALGTLCVYDRVPRTLTPGQIDALQTLAHQVVGQMELGRRVAEQERLIAERAQAEEKRRASEHLAQATLDSLTKMIAITDADGVILSVNKAWRRFGVENPPLPGGWPTNANYSNGANYLTVCDEARGNGADDARQTAAGIRAVAAGAQSSFSLEYPCHSPWEQRWFSLRVSRLRGDAQARLVIAHENVTDRKLVELALRESLARLTHSETRLRLALEGGRLGTYELDLATGQFLETTDTFKGQFGLPPDAEFSLTTLIALIHPEDRDRMWKIVEQATAARTGFEAEHRVVWPDGAIRWLRIKTISLSDADGRPTRQIGVSEDITGRKQIEAEREQALQDAEARAARDPLTGLLNHRGYHARLAAEIERAEREGTVLAFALLDLDDFRFFNEVYGSAVGDTVLRMVADRLRATCGAADVLAHFGGDEYTVLLPDAGPSATPSRIETRLRMALNGLFYQPPGEASPIPITASVGAALYPRIQAGEAAGDAQEPRRRAEERLRRAKTGSDMETEADRVRTHAERSLSGFSMLDALVTAVDNKDRYTRRHSEDVMTYSLLIARQLGLGDAALQTISRAALLHDVGKIGVPDSILRKPGKLTDAEFEAIKQHPMMGAIMVGAVPGLEDTLDAVRHHHERWDGDGYPFGLRGEETPEIARLMAVADAFSAMTTDRPYRAGMAHARALAILREGSGAQWDPRCVSAFLAALAG